MYCRAGACLLPLMFLPNVQTEPKGIFAIDLAYKIYKKLAGVKGVLTDKPTEGMRRGRTSPMDVFGPPKM